MIIHHPKINIKHLNRPSITQTLIVITQNMICNHPNTTTNHPNILIEHPHFSVDIKNTTNDVQNMKTENAKIKNVLRFAGIKLPNPRHILLNGSLKIITNLKLRSY